MTTLEPAIPAAIEPEGAEVEGLRGFERYLTGVSERSNPILVKEARQALKSRQFLITYTLLLLAGWCWTVLGVAIWSPGIYFSAGGGYMLVGYCIVLNIPLLLVVPFTAFRSLAAEREYGTFELMSITTLSSRQIITGKLGSAALQMLVYYSAIAPCIAFTYLLRGVDIISIFLMLTYTFFVSLLASAVSLLMATVTRSQAWQILISVLVLIGLGFLTIMWCSFTVAFITEGGFPLDDATFWLANLALLTGHVSYMILFVYAAAAQISFASDNRSTKLRVILLGQQVLFLAWMYFFWLLQKDFEILSIFLIFSAIHWAVAGSLLIGERAELSPRVKRRLPQSFLGRLTLTWFNPGSGTGYTFVAANMLAVSAAVIAAGLIGEQFNFGRGYDRVDWAGLSIYAWCYVVAYLGLARFVVLFVQRYFYFGLALPFLVTLLLAAAGAFFPWVFQAWILGFDQADEYTTLQAPNWMFTVYECLDGDFSNTLGTVIWKTPVYGFRVPLGSFVLVILFAAFVLVVNSLLVVAEVEQVRQATPRRVVQDDLELKPEKQTKPKKLSPWDDELS